MTARIVTFSSDFGTRDYYVGAVKGAILGLNPEVNIIDLNHDVPSHDILAGAFVLAGSYDLFPSGTIHLAVVDPGVGSSRRGLVVSTERHLFVVPDNGLLSLVYQRETVSQVISIESEHYFRRPVCPTFHARDIFGPVAAWLSRGIDPSKFGPPVTDYRRLTLPAVTRTDQGEIEGRVVHVDKFGNVITSLRAEDLPGRDGAPGSFICSFNGRTIRQLHRYYDEGSSEEPFLIVGSSGYLEIALSRRPASALLEARRGMKVTLRTD